jgi:4-oxalocrotonate tautomerase
MTFIKTYDFNYDFLIRTSAQDDEARTANVKGDHMPLVRIDLNKDAPAERVRIVSQAVYGAMTELANVPVNDKFQIVTRHSADEIIYPEDGYLGIRYSPDLIIIQVTWVGGRSTDVKKQFYRRIADEIHAKAGVRKEDVWIALVDNAREDWSFGNGDMQYAPK